MSGTIQLVLISGWKMVEAVAAIIVITALALFYYESSAPDDRYVNYVAVVSEKDSYTDEHIWLYSFRKAYGDGMNWHDALWCENETQALFKVDDITLSLTEYTYEENEAYTRALGVVESPTIEASTKIQLLRDIGEQYGGYLWRWKAGLPSAGTYDCYVETFYQSKTPIFDQDISGLSVSNKFSVTYTGEVLKALEDVNLRTKEEVRTRPLTPEELQELNKR